MDTSPFSGCIGRAAAAVLMPAQWRFLRRSHRRFDAVLLYIEALTRELAGVMLRSNHEYRGAGHQQAAVARGVSEDRGDQVNRVFGFTALVADFDDVALRCLGNRADRGIGHYLIGLEIPRVLPLANAAQRLRENAHLDRVELAV